MQYLSKNKPTYSPIHITHDLSVFTTCNSPSFSDYFGNIDVGDGWWRRNVLATTFRCWTRKSERMAYDVILRIRWSFWIFSKSAIFIRRYYSIKISEKFKITMAFLIKKSLIWIKFRYRHGILNCKVLRKNVQNDRDILNCVKFFNFQEIV